jgi:hypothetical protein
MYIGVVSGSYRTFENFCLPKYLDNIDILDIVITFEKRTLWNRKKSQKNESITMHLSYIIPDVSNRKIYRVKFVLSYSN